MRNAYLLCLLVFTTTNSALFADDAKSTQYDYPELLVTPRATERLKIEARDEESSVWTMHLPIQASALVTTMAGVMALSDKGEKKDQEKEDAAKNAGQLGIGIGIGWLATTAFVSATYRPYKTALAEVKKLPGKSKQEELTQERFAEEGLLAPARLARRLNLLAVSTNIVAGGYIAATGQEDMTKVMGALAVLTTALPLLFNYHWQDVACYHESYKKRIYGPLTSVSLLYDERARKMAPGLVASLSL